MVPACARRSLVQEGGGGSFKSFSEVLAVGGFGHASGGLAGVVDADNGPEIREARLTGGEGLGHFALHPCSPKQDAALASIAPCGEPS